MPVGKYFECVNWGGELHPLWVAPFLVRDPGPCEQREIAEWQRAFLAPDSWWWGRCDQLPQAPADLTYPLF